MNGYGSLEWSVVQKFSSKVEGRTKIVQVKPHGKTIRKGEIVCELDSDALKAMLRAQTETTKTAHTGYQTAKLAREVAETARDEYVNGNLKQEIAALKSRIATAITAVGDANDRLKRTRHVQKRMIDALAKKGAAATLGDLLAGLDVDDRLEVAERRPALEQTALEQAKSELDVLEKYTRKKTTDGLYVAIVRMRADELAKEAVWDLETSKVTSLNQQIANCSILAPFDGQVVLAYDPSRAVGVSRVRVGSPVSQGQLIFSLIKVGDAIQVNTKVPESLIDSIKPLQTATIELKRFSGRKLAGVLKSVASAPDPGSRFGTSVYTVTVEIPNAPRDVRPNMTAQVNIYIGDVPNLRSVPRDAVLTFDAKRPKITW